jgi:glycosyltransferase involved in cell wall biosynthesis
MKIALIGPGIINIPPPGHGAVEILIWDYYLELTLQGHQVDIINKMRKNGYYQSGPYTDYCRGLIEEINSGKYDFVHLHYDCLYHILPFLICKTKAITSHYPYIDQIERHVDGYDKVFKEICKNDNHYIFALSKKDLETFVKYGANPNRIFLLLNGSNHNEIQPIKIQKKTKSEKSIYIAKIEPRKMQHIYKDIPNIDFYGKCDDSYFKSLECFKGEYNHTDLMNIMANYGNLILLSNGENGTPLVIKEALMAGLPIVTNRHSSNDLDTSLSFIDIIPDEKLHDFEYIQEVIKKNIKKQDQQEEIKKYALTNFSWELLIKKYIENITSTEKN